MSVSVRFWVTSYRLIESAWTLAIVAVLVAVMYALTGCAATPVKPVIELQRPVLPEVQSAELECLSWDAYVRLRQRDLLLHQAVDDLTLIVCEIAECPR